MLTECEWCGEYSCLLSDGDVCGFCGQGIVKKLVEELDKDEAYEVNGYRVY